MRFPQDGFGAFSGEHSFVSPEDVEVFLRIGTVMDLPRHATLHRAGTVPGSCYYILEGEVESFDSIASGNERIFRRSGAGALILLPAMMIRHELHLSFRTTCPGRLIRISRDQIQEYFLETPDFAARTVRAVSELYVGMMEQYWALKNFSLSWRLCSLLLELAGQCGADYDGKVMLTRSLSQQEMAALLQSSRVSVARAMKRLKDLNLVEYVNGFYCIRSISRLRRHMETLERE